MGADGTEAHAVETWRQGPVSVVQLSRPRVHNALNEAMMQELHRQLLAADQDPSVRALVLTGAGASFCSGDDLRIVREARPEDFKRAIDGLQALTVCLFQLRKPVVCAFNGPAFGAGLELALACDARLATQTFVCSTPEVQLGLIITNGASVLLPLLIGGARARRLMLTGSRVDAQWCLQAGLVDELVPDDSLIARAVELAGAMASGAPMAIAESRRLLNAPLLAALNEALRAEARQCVLARESRDGREGVVAFFEGRAPVWELMSADPKS